MKNGFARREEVGDAYWKDPRWKKVQKLRKLKEHAKANGLVLSIRSDWNVK